MRKYPKFLRFFLLTVLVSGNAVLHGQETSTGGAPTNDTSAVAVAQLSEPLVVYKGPLCFCCKKWISHLYKEGIQNEVDNAINMSEIKGQWGVPNGLHGCHTAVLRQKYVFEGHVPARYIRKYLGNPPEGSFGLTVPGMPEGSPGMYDGKDFKPYNIYLLMRGGDYRFYARVEKPEPH